MSWKKHGLFLLLPARLWFLDLSLTVMRCFIQSNMCIKFVSLSLSRCHRVPPILIMCMTMGLRIPASTTMLSSHPPHALLTPRDPPNPTEGGGSERRSLPSSRRKRHGSGLRRDRRRTITTKVSVFSLFACLAVPLIDFGFNFVCS